MRSDAQKLLQNRAASQEISEATIRVIDEWSALLAQTGGSYAFEASVLSLLGEMSRTVRGTPTAGSWNDGWDFYGSSACSSSSMGPSAAR